MAFMAEPPVANIGSSSSTHRSAMSCGSLTLKGSAVQCTISNTVIRPCVFLVLVVTDACDFTE